MTWRWTVVLVASLAALWLLPGRAGAEEPFTCTQVIGFSQTAEWYAGDPTFESIVDDEGWQLLYNLGAIIDYWADPDFGGWSKGIESPCTQDSTDPDRVILNVSGFGTRTPPEWATAIQAAIATIRSKYPNIRQIALQPTVGGPQHQTCPTGGGGDVNASVVHPNIDEGISLVVGDDIVAGASPKVTSCDDYSDSIGHLTSESLPTIAASIASAYGKAPIGGIAELPDVDAAPLAAPESSGPSAGLLASVAAAAAVAAGTLALGGVAWYAKQHDA